VSDQTSEHSHPVSLLPPAVDAALEYAIDTWQRNVLYADVMRQRGNQYQRHMSKQAPNVLSMKAEVVLDGRSLERPVNYILTRITPPKSMPIDPIKRPFVVVDPRAGHGPGIAGFKPESEIGVALEAGHPCYFIGFLPRPEPDQGVEDVVWAETRFLEEVIALHPEAEGKPVVIGNCQAGWQLMMAAATRPELFGPIIIAGAPLSYWAGWRNKNPMRYTGGMTGGSWMTTMASDLGGGLFDGANLVQNFENLHPSNTYWSKQYNLYANVDTEASRYLGFERWWGGHVFLNGKEIQYIVDNLFVGNKLSTARLVTQDGLRIDLRNIRSPIIVFCSKGDNITPPPQALGWITDLYQNDKEVLAHGQTIIYAVHESIGHLGIFVSGAVAKKEHREFTCNIDLIDMLPPGIYEAVIRDKTPDTPNADLAYGDYVLTFERRHLADIEAIVQPREDDDRRFAAVSRISQVNQGLYKSFVQPWVKAFATPRSTQRREQTHPLRMHYEAVSDKNPVIAALAPVAVQVKNKRRKAAADNPFVQFEKQISKSIESSLDLWGEWRDAMIENTFMAVYGSSLVQDIAGLGAREGSPREHPGVSPEHIAFVRRRVDELRKLVQCGGLREASVRVMMYIAQAQGGIDERSFNLIRQLRAQQEHSLSLAAFKKLVREQAMVMVVDPEGAIDAIPALLSHHSSTEIKAALEFVTRVAMASGALNAEGKKRLAQVARFYDLAAQQSSQTNSVDGLTSVNLRRAPTTNLSKDTASPAREPALTKVIAKKAPTKKAVANKVVTKKMPAKTVATKKVSKSAAKTPLRRAKKAIV
jgi:pimeloyl-ACP methyl ester carboxylesterase